MSSEEFEQREQKRKISEEKDAEKWREAVEKRNKAIDEGKIQGPKLSFEMKGGKPKPVTLEERKDGMGGEDAG